MTEKTGRGIEGWSLWNTDQGAENARDHGPAVWRWPGEGIEQISGNLLNVNHGAMYPVLLRLEQEGSITSAWGVPENSRRARFYRITAAGRKQRASEQRHWQQTTEIPARFFGLEGAS